MAAESRTARDGAAYTHLEFVEFYGAEIGAAMWAEAPLAVVQSSAIVPFADNLALAGEGFFLDGLAFRVGPESHGYDYAATTVTWNGYPMYQCRRGRDSEPGLLFLLFTGARWEAGQVASGPAAASAAEVAQRMQPAFRGPIGVDVRVPGQHFWECYDSRRGAWWPPSSFRTTALRGPA